MMLLSVTGLKIFLSVIASWCFTYCVTPFCIKLAIHLNIIDCPDGKLKQHELVTPYLGGVAIFGGLFVGLTSSGIGWSVPFLVGMSILLALGLVDDIASLSPLQKIFLQFLAAFFIFMNGGTIAQEGNALLCLFGCHEYLAFVTSAVLEILFIMTIINAFNLIDIMDGLAATTALGSVNMLTLVALKLSCHGLAFQLIIYGATLLAFLRYNLPWAQIYLGDAGALTMGGFLAGMACQIPWFKIAPDSSIVSFFAMACILTTIFFIPFIEVVMLIMIRTYQHIPFFLGSPHHFVHYLKAKFFSIYKILVIVFLMNMILLLIVASFMYQFLTIVQYVVAMLNVTMIWLLFVYRPHQKKSYNSTCAGELRCANFLNESNKNI